MSSKECTFNTETKRCNLIQSKAKSKVIKPTNTLDEMLQQLEKFRSNNKDVRAYEFDSEDILEKNFEALKSIHVSSLSVDISTYIPECLTKLTSLKNLRIGTPYSGFEDTGIELPKSIGNLTNLESFVIFIEINSLPESIGNLKKLKELELNNTHISSIPKSIENLVNLKSLKIVGNEKLKQLPESFNTLINLEILYLDNEYTQKRKISPVHLPPNAFNKLKKLKILSIKNNSLLTVFPDILENKNLQSLDLSGSGFKKIPESISKLKNLKLLHVSRTPLDSLPEAISELKKLKDFKFSIARVERKHLWDNQHVLDFRFPKSFIKLFRRPTLQMTVFKELILKGHEQEKEYGGQTGIDLEKDEVLEFYNKQK